MPRRRYIFDPPDRFVAGTVGEPGDRTFFLQAREGGRIVSIALEKVQEARANQENFMRQAQAQQAYRQQQYLVQQAQTVLQKMPELRDPVKFAKWTEELKALAVAHNYQIGELSQVRDARLIGILNEAMENRRNKAANESLKAKLKVQQAAKPAPSVQQPQRRRTTATVQAENMRAALTRLRNNPSSQQAAEDVLSRFD